MFYSHTHTQTERTRWRDLKSPKHLSPSISWPERCPISLYVMPLGAKYEFLWILKFSGCCSVSPHLPHRTWHGHFHTAELPGTHSPKATAEDLEARLLVQSGTPAAAGRSGSWGPMSTASYWVRTRSGWSLFDSAVLFLSFFACFVFVSLNFMKQIEVACNTMQPWCLEWKNTSRASAPLRFTSFRQLKRLASYGWLVSSTRPIPQVKAKIWNLTLGTVPICPMGLLYHLPSSDSTPVVGWRSPKQFENVCSGCIEWCIIKHVRTHTHA